MFQSYLIICDHFFFDDFHGVQPSGFLEFHHQHFGVAASPDHSDKVEVVDRYDFPCGSGKKVDREHACRVGKGLQCIRVGMTISQ